MQLHTSNFAKSAGDPKAVSIANSAPKWFHGKSYKKLAPPWRLVKDNSISLEEWERQYREQILSKLDPRQVAEKLGNGAIMLCWEKAEDFCHRQIVAKWMRENGIHVTEIPSGQRKKVEEKKPVDKFAGLNDFQSRIVNIHEIRLTYPSGHCQSKKILEQMCEIAGKLNSKEKKQVEKIIGYKLEV